MRVLVDTNVVLDAIGKREPFYPDAAKILFMSAEGQIEAYITSNAVTDIYYIARRHYVDEGEARTMLRRLFRVIGVLDVGPKDCLRALDLPMNDYEDALLAACAKRRRADYIVTRDLEHFEDSPVAAVSPAELLRRFRSA